MMASLAVLYGTGMRRGELERLDVCEWCRDEGTLLVDGRKTGEERRAPVPVGVARCLDAYLPHRQNVLEKAGRLEETALFVTRSSQRLKGDAVGEMIHRLARRAKVPLVSVHQFRHTCASDLVEEGLTLPQVQQVLGHRAITSTMWYLSLSDPDLKQAIRRHPLNDILGEVSPARSHELIRREEAGSERAAVTAGAETGGSHE
jgi:site-specific recombinase XerD